MKFRNSKVLLATSVITVLAVGIYTTANYLFPTIDDGSSALTYGSNTDVSFTINPRLSISTSTDSLTIDNLVPGTTSDSNKVSVTVSSNTQYGYVLSAGVGSNDTTSPYYNTSSLTHENSTISNVFSSVDTNASLQSLDIDNTWGYSTSTDGGTSWSTYSGLSNTATKPLLDISNPAQPSTIDFKIAARSASTQASGTYNNVITFYAVGKPKPLTIYEEVAKMSKGTQDVTDLKTDITSPTSKDYREDTSNSGVYEYNSSVFGESSDASNANKIYYYRGILEPEEDQGQYGSDGQATTYPNYVKLDNDTCWRIVRTTGSGGVKMLYNGTWTGSTCANSQGETTTGSSAFDGYYGSNRQIVRVGYTYDTIYSSSYTKYFTMAELFGTNTTDNNSHSSDIKTETEAWYMRNISGYTSILEPSAGYCGDRTMYGIDYVLQPESISLPQYSRSTTSYYFGALVRNYTDAQLPSLTCAKFNDGTISVDRSKVDLYTVEGVSAGNNRLSQPIALLTADEATFAGSGKSASSSEGRPTYNIKSYMNTGTGFYLLSPYNRNSYGETHHFYLEPQSGRLSILYTNGIGSVRPVISLNSGITASAGSGIATDPWVVTAP